MGVSASDRAYWFGYAAGYHDTGYSSLSNPFLAGRFAVGYAMGCQQRTRERISKFIIFDEASEIPERAGEMGD